MKEWIVNQLTRDKVKVVYIGGGQPTSHKLVLMVT